MPTRIAKDADLGKAAYWCRRARKPVCQESLDAEWIIIARELLR
jgi:hypothetical protein